MKVNYLSKDVENKDKIPGNISIRTMQSDLSRLKDLANQKPTEISSEKLSDIDFGKETADSYLEKEAKKSIKRKILDFTSHNYKKVVPPAELPTELPTEKLEKDQPSFEKKNSEINEKEKITAEIFSEDKSLKMNLKKKRGGFFWINFKKKFNKKIILIIILILVLLCSILFFCHRFNLVSFEEEIGEENYSPIEEIEKKEKTKTIIPQIPFISKIKEMIIPQKRSFFIPVKAIFTFNVFPEKEFNLIAALENYLKTLEKNPQIALIEIKEENKTLELEKLFQKITLKVPEETMVNLKDNYNLFFLNFEDEHRLGLIIEIDNFKKVQKNISQWETTMVDDLDTLFLRARINHPSSSDFQENAYQRIKIRYLNFSESDTTIDYAFVGNKLIITTSKESIYRIIDILTNEK